MTIQQIAEQQYQNLIGSGAQDILEKVVNPAIEAYNLGQADPTAGSTYYGHLTPANMSPNVSGMEGYAAWKGLSDQLEYRLFPSETRDPLTGGPANYLIVNNIMALPQYK